MEADTQAKDERADPPKTFIEVFMDGARRGWDIGVRMIITSLIFAAVLVYVLRITGAMDLLIRLFSPVMGVFGLPAAAVVALVAGFFSKPGGCATAALLYSQGDLNRVHVTILFPAIILMGALVGQYVRIVVASGAERRHHPLMFAICFFDALLALAFMSLAMRLLGRL